MVQTTPAKVPDFGFNVAFWPYLLIIDRISKMSISLPFVANALSGNVERMHTKA
jgi:hypothetical protein